MNHDIPWIVFYATNSILVFAAYALIGQSFLDSFLKNKKNLRDLSIADMVSLGMASIFLLCGLVGYTFDLIRVWIPAYRLIAILRAILAILSFLTLFYVKRINFFQTFYKTEAENQQLKLEISDRDRQFLENQKKIDELQKELNHKANNE